MSHTYTTKDGTTFIYNPDLSGGVEVIRHREHLPAGRRHAFNTFDIPGSALVEFMRERDGGELDHAPVTAEATPKPAADGWRFRAADAEWMTVEINSRVGLPRVLKAEEIVAAPPLRDEEPTAQEPQESDGFLRPFGVKEVVGCHHDGCDRSVDVADGRIPYCSDHVASLVERGWFGVSPSGPKPRDQPTTTKPLSYGEKALQDTCAVAVCHSCDGSGYLDGVGRGAKTDACGNPLEVPR